jgi:hypothetical protein
MYELSKVTWKGPHCVAAEYETLTAMILAGSEKIMKPNNGTEKHLQMAWLAADITIRSIGDDVQTRWYKINLNLFVSSPKVQHWMVDNVYNELPRVLLAADRTNRLALYILESDIPVNKLLLSDDTDRGAAGVSRERVPPVTSRPAGPVTASLGTA